MFNKNRCSRNSFIFYRVFAKSFACETCTQHVWQYVCCILCGLRQLVSHLRQFFPLFVRSIFMCMFRVKCQTTQMCKVTQEYAPKRGRERKRAKERMSEWVSEWICQLSCWVCFTLSRSRSLCELLTLSLSQLTTRCLVDSVSPLPPAVFECFLCSLWHQRGAASVAAAAFCRCCNS